MAVDTLEEKAHELIGQLNPGKLAAVVHLLEVMVEEEPLREVDRRRFHEGQAFFDSGKGIPMDDVLAEYGLQAADFPVRK